MMPRHLSPICVLLSGLLLTACGGVVDAPEEMELTGTTGLALCSNAAVTSLTINGISTYQGEMAGSGNWAVSYPANAVRLEFRINNVLQSSSELSGTSGGWYFSRAGLSCGSYLFNVKAVPMVIDSGGGRTTCWANTSRSASSYADEPCPNYCGDGECSLNEDAFSCAIDCCQGRCNNGACCSSSNYCSDGSYCILY
ncbi:hypothetical protein [Archangium violaceum]|uniref:hypothetical protein n=1 Tax=Archangium violaceum TaxID=83451 RepID=UPI00126992E9|nr:hypothetical protein [Archangium violaceum]